MTSVVLVRVLLLLEFNSRTEWFFPPLSSKQESQVYPLLVGAATLNRNASEFNYRLNLDQPPFQIQKTYFPSFKGNLWIRNRYYVNMRRYSCRFWIKIAMHMHQFYHSFTFLIRLKNLSIWTTVLEMIPKFNPFVHSCNRFPYLS